MEGRAPGTKGIEKAAAFIAEEFKKAGIQPVANNSYFQEFYMQRFRFQSGEATVEGKNWTRNILLHFLQRKH
jgi:hypothetical protein